MKANLVAMVATMTFHPNVRRRLSLAVCLAFATGCGSVATGPTIVSDTGITWADATGATVDVFGDPTGPLFYRDESGLFWNIDPETVVVSAAIVDEGPLFESMDCTGPAYVVVPPVPRVTFLLDFNTNDPPNPVVHVRDDATKTEHVTICSAAQGANGGCSTFTTCSNTEAVSEAEATPSPPLTVPTVAFVAPLHPEVAK